MGDDAGGNLAAAVAQQVASLKQKCVRFEFAAQVRYKNGGVFNWVFIVLVAV